MYAHRQKVSSRKTVQNYTQKRREETDARQQADRQKALGAKKAQNRRSRSIYYGIMGHGAQFNAVQGLTTATFALPSNVRVVTLTIPGAALVGYPKSFHVFHAILKHLSVECLEDLFRSDSYGTELRRFMSRMLVDSNEFGNVGMHLYEGRCPNMLLNTTMNHRPGMAFAPFMKRGVDVQDRWVDQAPELATYSVFPDEYSFLFLKRKGDDRPLTVSELPPIADNDDFAQLLAAGYPPEVATKMLYSHEDMDVDPKLMSRYFDSAYTLSTFVRNECTDVSNTYHVIVFACRSPMYFDAEANELLFGNFMNINADAFVRNDASNDARRQIVPRSRANQNAQFARCDPTKIWI
jgi:hypothetical protein